MLNATTQKVLFYYNLVENLTNKDEAIFLVIKSHHLVSSMNAIQHFDFV